jgi:hypothetical protein
MLPGSLRHPIDTHTHTHTHTHTSFSCRVFTNVSVPFFYVSLTIFATLLPQKQLFPVECSPIFPYRFLRIFDTFGNAFAGRAQEFGDQTDGSGMHRAGA